jgi:hypothetical protein
MENTGNDASALGHIEKLVAEEHHLFENKSRTAAQEKRLKELQVKLDQYWDLLRQRRAAIETGGDPAKAHKRPPGTVENYEG